MPNSQLDLESKTKLSVTKAQNYMEGGLPHRKIVNWEGGTPHTTHTFLMERTIWVGRKHRLGGTYFVDGATIRVGTPHNIERKN